MTLWKYDCGYYFCNMVHDGWITRETDPEDRRGYLVSAKQGWS